MHYCYRFFIKTLSLYDVTQKFKIRIEQYAYNGCMPCISKLLLGIKDKDEWLHHTVYVGCIYLSLPLLHVANIVNMLLFLT